MWRLEQVAGARVRVEGPGVVKTVLVARVAWLRNRADAAKALIRAHAELTDWILEHPEEAQRRVVEEITLLTQSEMPADIVKRAWKRLKLTTEIDLPGLEQFVRDAQAADLISRVPPLDGMIYHPESSPSESNTTESSNPSSHTP